MRDVHKTKPIARMLFMMALAALQALTLSCGSPEQTPGTAEATETKQANGSDDDQQCGACALAPILAIQHPAPKCTLQVPQPENRALKETFDVGVLCTKELGTEAVEGDVTPAMRAGFEELAAAVDALLDERYHLGGMTTNTLETVRRIAASAGASATSELVSMYHWVSSIGQYLQGLQPGLGGGASTSFWTSRARAQERACQASAAVAAALAAILSLAPAAR